MKWPDQCSTAQSLCQHCIDALTLDRMEARLGVANALHGGDACPIQRSNGAQAGVDASCSLLACNAMSKQCTLSSFSADTGHHRADGSEKLMRDHKAYDEIDKHTSVALQDPKGTYPAKHRISSLPRHRLRIHLLRMQAWFPACGH